MQEELFNGNDRGIHRNGSNAHDKPHLSTSSTSEGTEIKIEKPKTENDNSFINSNRRLDSYHLFFSSWL
jgi:hypothetical protein